MGDPWREYKPDGKWRDWERMRGHKRYEVLIPVNKIVKLFKKLFGRKT